ncbi:hypothetical protein KXD40_004823 [Peronospora effusa]|uniref:CST complex subunit CTC1 n=1 Tax=Peronospora effusa TaxID=542832 RepID=A0A3R7W778_9STRA|nr:hypothetical protein DD237_002137 [Peronospora effusa]UIZ22365.1 hypothetical protein KXD40_004823 [Peronospora effusa]
MFLEIHDEKPVLLLPLNDLYTRWAQENVLQVLESSYQTKDPPMYTGLEPWAATSAARVQGDNVNYEVVQSMTGNGDMTTVRKQKTRKRVHVVFGRVTSVSPISRQKDRASCHFFVEIESQRSCTESTTQSTVNVMFTGVHSMRWRLFLRPGKKVLLTNLVKVFSRECEMFLLQTTHECALGHLPATDKGSMKTLVMVWNEPESSQMNILKCINDSLDFSKENATRCSGKLLDYEGKVCRLLWDECIELQGHDETRVIVSLFHFPYEQELVRLRIGGILRVYGAHVLRWPTPVGGKLVIGLCPKSHFAITAYGDPGRSCLVKETRPHRSRAQKKWSCLGDFHVQSAVLSMWILELLELLSAKFFFGKIEQVRLQSSVLSFPGIRRRRAAAQVAKKLQFSLSDDHTRTAMTLGALFLKCHATNADNCITLQLSPREKILTSTRALTIRELQAFGESKLSEKTEARSGSVRGFDELQSIRISAESLDWCLLLACIRGNIDTGDLEVCDRTGSIPLQLYRAETGMSHIGERGMYLIQNFDLVIEDYNQIEEVENEDKVPIVFCISCSVDDVEFVSIHEDDFAHNLQEENTAPDAPDDAQKPQELVFLVTHVDALPLSSVRSAGLLAQYRVVHGLVCPIGEGLQSRHFIKSMRTAEILVNTERVSWYIEKGGCYRVQALEVSLDDVNRGSSQYSFEDLAVELSIDYWKKAMVAEDNNLLCFDSLEQFRCHIGGESSTQKRPFRVYRVEYGQLISTKMECSNFERERCGLHDICRKANHDVNGVAVVPAKDDGSRGEDAIRTLNAKHLVKHALIEVTVPEYMAMSILSHFLRRLEIVVDVSSLLLHPLRSRTQQSGDDGKSVEEGLTVNTVEPNLHKPHLVSIVGIITKKKYYWQSNSQQQSFGKMLQTATVGVKRTRECYSSIAGGSRRKLRAIFHVRDLEHLDTVEIRIDASRFGVLGTLQCGNIVEFSRLQGFIARSSYKAFLSWGHLTAARLVLDRVCLPARDAELFGSMPTTFLNDLYHATNIDRMLHRYVVSVMHISYVLLKRKCKLCHQSLQLDKRRGCWKHAEPQSESKYSRDCARRWHQMAPSNPSFRARTYMGTTVRCVIDDGSGQAELFAENDVAWELLMCTDGQRQRFTNILSNYVDELKYFSGRTANESFATSKAERDQEYYQNELRAFVLDTMPSLRSMVVFAQQFYSAKQKESTSVLTFGNDIHITTRTVSLPKLEAKRVDQVHVRNELKRRLV